jgi:hypothetical protein
MQKSVFKHLMKRINFQNTSLIAVSLPHLFTTTEFHHFTISSSSCHFLLRPRITSPHQTLPHPPGMGAVPLLVAPLLPQPHHFCAVDTVLMLVVPPQVQHLQQENYAVSIVV